MSYVIIKKLLQGWQKSTLSSSAAVLADDDLIRVETCTDPRGPNRSEEATSTAADDDLIKNLPPSLNLSTWFKENLIFRFSANLWCINS